MKKIICIALIIFFSSTSWASEEKRTITVTGDADVHVIPDKVTINLGVQSFEKELDSAKRNNDQIIQMVMTVFKEFKIDPKYIKTNYIRISPEYETGTFSKRKIITGYSVNKDVVITFHDLDRFEDLLTKVLQSGVNNVYNIQFQTTKLRENKDKARKMAIQAAKEKALDLASSLDQKIGSPTHIQEEQMNWFSHGRMAQNTSYIPASYEADMEPTISPGMITINAKVSVTFELR